MPSDFVLSTLERAFLASARRAVLATIAPDRLPRLVPICFVVDDDRPVLYTPLDDKPKRTGDPIALARVRDLLADPRVSVLVDRWDEDWTRLAWLRCDGRAELSDPTDADADADADAAGHARVVAALRSRYPQYETHRLESRPLIRIAIERTTSWGALDEA
jgi:PPOX class probable F420-dependent enzyme